MNLKYLCVAVFSIGLVTFTPVAQAYNSPTIESLTAQLQILVSQLSQLLTPLADEKAVVAARVITPKPVAAVPRQCDVRFIVKVNDVIVLSTERSIKGAITDTFAVGVWRDALRTRELNFTETLLASSTFGVGYYTPPAFTANRAYIKKLDPSVHFLIATGTLVNTNSEKSGKSYNSRNPYIEAQVISKQQSAKDPHAVAVYANVFRCSGDDVPVELGKQCVYNGVKINSGAVQIFYSSQTVEKGISCNTVQQVRTCMNGKMSGSNVYQYDSCAPLERFTGINVNRFPEFIDTAALKRVKTPWVRATADVTNYHKNTAYDFSNWNNYKVAHSAGKKTILSIMWEFEKKKERIPLPNSPREKELFAYLENRILAELLASSDIVVSGNEPFVNTLPEDTVYNEQFKGIPIVIFHERVTQLINQYMLRQGVRDQHKLYVGSFTRLFDSDMRTGTSSKAVAGLFEFAQRASYVDGVDLHLHVSTLNNIESGLKYASSLTDKPIIITEYSYIHAQARILDDRIDLGDKGAFAKKYALASSTTVRQLMLQADKVPMTKTMWDDFHKSQPWVIDHFTLKADEIFKRYKVMGSAVQFGNGLRMSPDADGGSINQKNPQPWYFNSILMSFLVERQPNGLPQPNYQFLDDFVSLQKK